MISLTKIKASRKDLRFSLKNGWIQRNTPSFYKKTRGFSQGVKWIYDSKRRFHHPLFCFLSGFISVFFSTAWIIATWVSTLSSFCWLICWKWSKACSKFLRDSDHSRQDWECWFSKKLILASQRDLSCSYKFCKSNRLDSKASLDSNN